MKFQNLERIGWAIDVDPLLRELEARPELWAENTLRQNTPGSPHRDTECIFLRWAKDHSVRGVFEDVTTADYGAWEILPHARILVDQVMAAVRGTELGRVMIAKLRPQGFITPHPDDGAYADHFERFHVSLQSEFNNWFYVGDPERWHEGVHMRAGELWWFNHKQKHWVCNGSAAPRIHLIVDCVAPKYRRERE